MLVQSKTISYLVLDKSCAIYMYYSCTFTLSYLEPPTTKVGRWIPDSGMDEREACCVGNVPPVRAGASATTKPALQDVKITELPPIYLGCSYIPISLHPSSASAQYAMLKCF